MIKRSLSHLKVSVVQRTWRIDTTATTTCTLVTTSGIEEAAPKDGVLAKAKEETKVGGTVYLEDLCQIGGVPLQDHPPRTMVEKGTIKDAPLPQGEDRLQPTQLYGGLEGKSRGQGNRGYST